MLIAFCGVLISLPARSNEAGDALRQFGLLGSWSANCEQDPKSPDGERITYWISFFGTPRVTEILTHRTFVTNIGYTVQENESRIVEAGQMVDKSHIKIKVVLTSHKENGNTVELPEFFNQPITSVILKDDSRIRVVAATSLEGGLSIGNGQYKSSGRETPWLLRCPD
jgi:hypothetical protein